MATRLQANQELQDMISNTGTLPGNNPALREPFRSDSKRKTLGLALGSGSARGFAHFGVLRVLEENAIPIDCIVGSSMGSVVGGIYACGTDIDMICKTIPMLRETDYFDIVVPRRGGFLRGNRFQELIQLLTKRYDFSQTQIPFACVAVDVMSGQLVVIEEGSLDDGIRASIAIPGVFQPHVWQGRTLFDGGVISRVPCETARNMACKPDVVLGVDVGYRGEMLERDPVTLMDYLFVATDIMSWETAKLHEDKADLMLVPNVRDCDPNSFRDFETSIEAGRAAAEEALPRIRKLLGLPAVQSGGKTKRAAKTTLRRKKKENTPQKN